MSSPTPQPVSTAPDSKESQARGAAVPVALIVFMVLLFYWGAIYFDTNGGWFSPKVYAPYHSVEEVQAYQPSTGGLGPILEFGKYIYNKPTCSACHQPTGLGSPGQYPPLAGSDWVLEKDPGRIIRAVLDGLQPGPIKVSGQTVSYPVAMVPWKEVLKDDEIAAVLTYVRNEWGNSAPPVTPEQVKAVREKTAARKASYTADELMQVSPAE
jgi:mono/diheme cytochrome c family protein